MKKLLAIGNSFSEDATAYLHDMAKAGGIETKVVNLYIGGCPLSLHMENIKTDSSDYEYQLNGSFEGRMASIKEALLEENWDFVTMQQASHDSGIEGTYYPYIEELSAYVKKYVPTAVQLIHQTWAYEIDSTHGEFYRYGKNQKRMYNALKNAYSNAAATIGVRLIPCGDTVQYVRGLEGFDYKKGGQSLCRDGFHMHFIYGRYLTAAVWYETILGGNILNNPYIPAGECSADLLQTIKSAVHKNCSHD